MEVNRVGVEVEVLIGSPKMSSRWGGFWYYGGEKS